jgi:hypothetical protein
MGAVTPEDTQDMDAWHRYIISMIKIGFRNLRTVTLVTPEDQRPNWTWQHPLDVMERHGAAGEETCKKELERLYEMVNEIDPSFRIPKVILIQYVAYRLCAFRLN